MLVQRHLVLVAWMVAGLLLINGHIDVDAFYRPLVLWALQHWQTPGQHLHLALDATMLWNCCCVAVISVDSPVSSCSAGSRAGPVGAT
jgi:hypothetical protein